MPAKQVKTPNLGKPHLHFWRGYWRLEPSLKGSPDDGGENWEASHFWRGRMNNEINNTLPPGELDARRERALQPPAKTILERHRAWVDEQLKPCDALDDLPGRNGKSHWAPVHGEPGYDRWLDSLPHGLRCHAQQFDPLPESYDSHHHYTDTAKSARNGEERTTGPLGHSNGAPVTQRWPLWARCLLVFVVDVVIFLAIFLLYHYLKAGA